MHSKFNLILSPLSHTECYFTRRSKAYAYAIYNVPAYQAVFLKRPRLGKHIPATTNTRVEAGSNTSTVTLRVVRGDEKRSLKSETVI
jgi:hypothetical protein